LLKVQCKRFLLKKCCFNIIKFIIFFNFLIESNPKMMTDSCDKKSFSEGFDQNGILFAALFRSNDGSGAWTINDFVVGIQTHSDFY